MRDSYVLSLTSVAQQDCTMSPQPDITRHSPTFPDLVRQDCNMSGAELHVEQATTDCAPCNATCTCDVSWQVMIWRCHMIRVSHMITGKGLPSSEVYDKLHHSLFVTPKPSHVSLIKHDNTTCCYFQTQKFCDMKARGPQHVKNMWKTHRLRLT